MKICRNLFHLISCSRFNIEPASFLTGTLRYDCCAGLLPSTPTLNGPRLTQRARPILLVCWMLLIFCTGLVQLLLQPQELSELIHALRIGCLWV
jgi:hypothetical protein